MAELLNDEEVCRAMGAAGRRYAEATFSPRAAADHFLGVFGERVAVPEPSAVPVPVRVRVPVSEPSVRKHTRVHAEAEPVLVAAAGEAREHRPRAGVCRTQGARLSARRRSPVSPTTGAVEQLLKAKGEQIR